MTLLQAVADLPGNDAMNILTDPLGLAAIAFGVGTLWVLWKLIRSPE